MLSEQSDMLNYNHFSVSARCSALPGDNFLHVCLVSFLIPNLIKLFFGCLHLLVYSINFIFLKISVPGPLTFANLDLYTYHPRILLGKHLGDSFFLSPKIDLLFGWNTTFSYFIRKDAWEGNYLRACMSENVFSPLHTYRI